MSTRYLKLCLLWLCFPNIWISIFSLKFILYFSSNFVLFYFKPPIKILLFFKIAGRLSFFVLLLVPHSFSFADSVSSYLLELLVVYAAVCSSVLPYFYWVSLYVLSLIFQLLHYVLSKVLVLLHFPSPFIDIHAHPDHIFWPFLLLFVRGCSFGDANHSACMNLCFSPLLAFVWSLFIAFFMCL